MLLAAWRVSRDVELADAICQAEWQTSPISGESDEERHKSWLRRAGEVVPADVGPLLELVGVEIGEVREIERLEALGRWPADPRIGRHFLKLLDELPDTTDTSNEFWRALCKVLPRHAGQDTHKALARTTGTHGRRATDRWVGKGLNRSVDKAVKSFQVERALKEKEQQACRHLISFLNGGPSTEQEIRDAINSLTESLGSPSGAYEKSRRKIGDVRSEEDFLDEIVAHPDDDDVRLIFADWLIEHNDPWGELIQLQIHRGEGSPTKQREAQLIRTLHDRLQGPLKGIGSRSDFVYERGFPYRVHVTGPSQRVGKTIGEKRWGTVEHLSEWQWKIPVELVLHPVMASLKSLHLSLQFEEIFELLEAKNDFLLETLSITNNTYLDPSLLGAIYVQGFPRLRHFATKLGESLEKPGDIRPFFQNPFCQRLERLGLQVAVRGQNDFFFRIWQELDAAGFNELELASWIQPGHPSRWIFTRDEDGEFSRLQIYSEDSDCDAKQIRMVFFPIHSLRHVTLYTRRGKNPAIRRAVEEAGAELVIKPLVDTNDARPQAIYCYPP